MNSAQKPSKKYIEKIGILSSPNSNDSMLQAERGRRADLIWEIRELLNSNLAEFCRFIRVTIFGLSEREFAALTGLKPILVKRCEEGKADDEVSVQVEVALIGLLHVFKGNEEIKKMTEKIAFLKNKKREAYLKEQLVNKVLSLIDNSGRDVGRFVRSLIHEYRLHKEEAVFVLDKSPEELEKLLSGEYADNRRIIGAIEYKIDEFTTRLAIAIVDPMFEKNGSEGELASDAGSAEGLPTADIITKVAASIRNGEASPS